MADARHVARLQGGVAAWNAWRRRSPRVKPDLSRALLVEAELRGVNFSNTNLERANLRSSTLSRANLSRANLRGADLRAASLRRARLDHADLTGAILRYTSLIDTRIEGARLTGCEVYGMSAWNLRGTPCDQSDLVIRADRREPALRVDDLEIAQFVYLLLHNDKVRSVIETVGKRAVLILGRFTVERKALLDAVRELLRRLGYVAMMFDFIPSQRRDLTETIVALAHMTRFVIADITDARAVLQELTAIIPGLPSVPVLPLIHAGERESPMFGHWRRYPWVLPLVRYRDQADLLRRLERSFIARAERKAKRQTGV